jgi:hypothetical protein
MRDSVASRIFLLMLATMLVSRPAAAQQTGILSGVVRDAQGGMLPGVTITIASPALIGGARTTDTGSTGTYQFTALPPGVYEVSYELSGFSPLKRADIRIQVAQVTRLDVDLKIGGLQETVVVTGLSPVVDVGSTTTQTNVSKEIFDTIPTGRNPWVMAALVPGVITGRLDVGGTEGMQQYNVEAFGSADSQKSFSIDGLKTNWGGGAGGSTMQYYGFEMYEEYNMQTASGTAESDVSGVYMNMVTKSGGNRFSSDNNFYFMNDSLQGTNVDDELRRRLGLGAGQQTGAAGNPIDISYDWSSTLGGPLKRDKVWFFGATRRWRLDQLQIGARNADGSQAIDDNLIKNYMGKATWNAASTTKASFMFNRNLKFRFHRRDSPYLFTEDKASVLQDQPAQNYVAQVNQVLGKAAVLDARVGRMWGVFPTRYQKEVTPNDIAIRDIVQFTQSNAATEQSLNPNHRYQANATLSYFAQNLGVGSHDFKVGTQLSWEKMQYDRIRNGDLFLETSDGIALRAQIANTPVASDHRLQTWSAFAQDRWVLGRATINYGARFDGVQAFLPAQASPAGTFVAARSFARNDLYNFNLDVAPRFGVSYDIFGKGRTALKAYYGRFYNQFGSEIAEAINPNARINVQIPWVDRDNDLILDTGELNLANFTGFTGVFPRMDANATRPYSDEMNVGIDHELAKNFGVSVSFHRRQHRNGLAIVDLARPASAYTPVSRTYLDQDRVTQSITVYSLDPALITRRDRVVTNVDVLESDYNGVQFSFNKRMSNRWQLLGGLSLQKHEGFNHSGTFTDPGSSTDLNNPNFRLNRDGSAIFTDIPWSFNLSGSYLFPGDVTFSGKFAARDGDPLLRTITIALPQASELIYFQPRGVDRTETVTQFVDIRVAKRFALGFTRLEGSIDVFNLLNANHVLAQNEAIGTTLGRPARILTPRIVRLGATLRF